MSKSALSKALADFKADERSTVTAAGVLTKIVNDYCREGIFSEYMEQHRMEAGLYLPESQHRDTRWRASSAGNCPQQQAYETLFRLVVERSDPTEAGIEMAEFAKSIVVPPMNPNHRRALYNGTFNHVRYHMMFDHLHVLERVRTIAAEAFRTDQALSLSGTIDRLVAFTWEGKELQIIIDFKTLKSSLFKELIYAAPSHAKQLTDYYLLKFPCEWGMVLYENKDTHEISIQDVPWSDVAIQALRDQYRMMNQWVDQMLQGVPLGERVKLPIITDWCSRCPYNKMCNVEHPEREAAILEGLPGDGVF